MQLEDELDRLRIRLAVEEALLNGLYRGNLEISPLLRHSDRETLIRQFEARSAEPPYRDRRVHVSWTIARDGITVVVKDDGSGFDVAASANREENVDFDTVFGRGLLIMRTFMDEIRYNAAGNEVTLIKRDPTEWPSLRRSRSTDSKGGGRKHQG